MGDPGGYSDPDFMDMQDDVYQKMPILEHKGVQYQKMMDFMDMQEMPIREGVQDEEYKKMVEEEKNMRLAEDRRLKEEIDQKYKDLVEAQEEREAHEVEA